MSQVRNFLLPPVITTGPGATRCVGHQCVRLGLKNALVITDKVMSQLGVTESFTRLLEDAGVTYTIYDDVNTRENVMIGALQTSIAFSNSSVALVHGMSRPIGAYFHVVHGASNATLLSTIMKFSLPGNPERYADIGEALSEDTKELSAMEAAQRGAGAVSQLLKDVEVAGMPDLGVEKARLEELAPRMARDAIDSGSPANNPRQASAEEIIELYMAAYNA